MIIATCADIMISLCVCVCVCVCVCAFWCTSALACLSRVHLVLKEEESRHRKGNGCTVMCRQLMLACQLSYATTPHKHHTTLHHTTQAPHHTTQAPHHTTPHHTTPHHTTQAWVWSELSSTPSFCSSYWLAGVLACVLDRVYRHMLLTQPACGCLCVRFVVQLLPRIDPSRHLVVAIDEF